MHWLERLMKMVQKISILLWACVFLVALLGCTKSETLPEQTETVVAVETAASKQTEAVCYTEADILDMFNGYAYADPCDRTVIDCVVMEKSEYGILGVVQYTTEDYDGCWFDFLTGGVPLTAGIDASPSGEKTLAFLKKDTVTCQLTVNGNVHTFTLSYYRNDLENCFRISSESA